MEFKGTTWATQLAHERHAQYLEEARLDHLVRSSTAAGAALRPSFLRRLSRSVARHVRRLLDRRVPAPVQE